MCPLGIGAPLGHSKSLYERLVPPSLATLPWDASVGSTVFLSIYLLAAHPTEAPLALRSHPCGGKQQGWEWMGRSGEQGWGRTRTETQGQKHWENGGRLEEGTTETQKDRQANRRKRKERQ